MNEISASRAARVGGWSLIAAAVGFLVVFTWLAARFNYPDVLDGAAADVLPKLLGLGATGRGVWMVYAILPLFLIPAGIGAHAAWGSTTPNAMRAALVAAVISAFSMLLGLARWPSVHWELAQAYATATPEGRIVIDSIFSGLNAYLGNFIGEFVGELSLNAFFALTAVALLRSGRRVAGWTGIAVAVIGFAAAFRNVTPAVSLVADANNVVLPIWLIVLGVLLIRPNHRTEAI